MASIEELQRQLLSIQTQAALEELDAAKHKREYWLAKLVAQREGRDVALQPE